MALNRRQANFCNFQNFPIKTSFALHLARMARRGAISPTCPKVRTVGAKTFDVI
jgi:hypothetical protein